MNNNISNLNNLFETMFYITDDSTLSKYVCSRYGSYDINFHYGYKQGDDIDNLIKNFDHNGDIINDWKKEFLEEFDFLYRMSRKHFYVEQMFKKKYRSWADTTMLKSSSITFSEPYINELNSIYHEISLSFIRDNMKSLVWVGGYTLGSQRDFRPKKLRDSLVENRLIDKNTRTPTIYLAFRNKSKLTKINWIGGKYQLATFLKILKDEKLIINNDIYAIAKDVFICDGKEINKLVTPKPKDSNRYLERLYEIIDYSFEY